jgi:hypothetical protein
MTTNSRNILLATTVFVGFSLVAASETPAAPGLNVNRGVAVRPAGVNVRPTVAVRPAGINFRPTVTVRPAGVNVRTPVAVRPAGINVINPSAAARPGGVNVNPSIPVRPAGINVINPGAPVRPAGNAVGAPPAPTTSVAGAALIPPNVAIPRTDRSRLNALLSRPLLPPSINNATPIGGGHGSVCNRGIGSGPEGANLFFENCWWYARNCQHGPSREWQTEYVCQSCPDLPGRACPAGTTTWR